MLIYLENLKTPLIITDNIHELTKANNRINVGSGQDGFIFDISGNINAGNVKISDLDVDNISLRLVLILVRILNIFILK